MSCMSVCVCVWIGDLDGNIPALCWLLQQAGQLADSRHATVIRVDHGRNKTHQTKSFYLTLDGTYGRVTYRSIQPGQDVLFYPMLFSAEKLQCFVTCLLFLSMTFNNTAIRAKSKYNKGRGRGVDVCCGWAASFLTALVPQYVLDLHCHRVDCW